MPLTGDLATHCLLFAGTSDVVVEDSVPNEVASPAGCATATVAAAISAAGTIRRVHEPWSPARGSSG